MLSFGITHRLTDLLIAIESSTHFYGRVLPALTAVIVTPHHNDASWLDAEPVPVPDHAWHTHPGGTTAVLTTLATALIITAADVAAGGGLESLSRRHLELAHRAYALLLADADEPTGEEGRRS